MRCLLTLLLALAAAPLQAQSFDEAVRSNTWLATDLCLQVMLDRVSPRAGVRLRRVCPAVGISRGE